MTPSYESLSIRCLELQKQIDAHGGQSWIEIQKTCSVQHEKLEKVRGTLRQFTTGLIGAAEVIQRIDEAMK